MIVLHGGFSESLLWLWGEVPAEERLSHSNRPRKQATASELPFLVYDAGKDKLFEAVAEFLRLKARAKKQFEQSIVWLPTACGKPIPSNSFIGEAPKSPDETYIAAWAVTALPLDAERSLSLLSACAGKDVLKPGVVMGEDLTFWVTAMRFAGAIVARQQFLPSVARTKGDFRAWWRPVIAGADIGRLRQLAQSMPPAARAIGKAQQPDVPALNSVSQFIEIVTDHLVRFSGYAIPPSQWAAGMRTGKPPGLESLHDQWTFALRSFDGRLEGEETDLERFAAAVEEWQRPISAAVSAPIRLCFRLEEPSTEDKEKDGFAEDPRPWQVRYLLQAAHDPSLLIPGKEAWKPRAQSSSIFRESGFNARESLLMFLGQAAGICPQIEASLRKTKPDGYTLDAMGAYEFLTEKALALEQSGFGVMLPAWWTRKGTKLRLSAKAHVNSSPLQGGARVSLDDLVDFRWEIALGGESVSIEELQEIARLKAPLVKVRGQWVQLTAEEIQAALDFWKNQNSGSMQTRDVVRMALGASVVPLELDGITATGWVGDLLARLEDEDQIEPLAAPEGFCGTLRPYQLRGYSWLAFLRRWGLGACLTDDMGLGKTIQTLSLLERDAHADIKRPTLLICPTSVVGNWHKDAARFTPRLRVMVHHGTARTKSRAFAEQAAKHHLVISTYALLQRDFEILQDVPWSGLVLDEAQNIKNHETKQARAARSLAADYRVALTGTPVENNVGDLWSIMEFLNPGLLGTQTEFRKSFFILIQAWRDEAAMQRLKKQTGPFILRRLKTDKAIIADLPEKMEMKVFCNLTKKQASLYAAVVEEATQALESAEGIKRKGLVLATLSKLKQVCNHPAHFLGENSSIAGRSGKLARLTEMAEEILAAGERALIFSQFREMGDILKRHLEDTFGRGTLFLHGGVPIDLCIHNATLQDKK